MIATLEKTITGDCPPPQNTDAEEALLGGILLEPGAITRVADILPPEAFYLTWNQIIYRAAMNIHKDGRETDLMNTTTYLADHQLLDKMGGQGYLARLVETTVSAVNIDRYASLIVDKFHRRQLIELGETLKQSGFDTFSPLEEVKKRVARQFKNWEAGVVSKEEKEKLAYNQLISQLEEIEMRCDNPALRQFKLQLLSKQHGVNQKTLTNIWVKHLTSQECSNSRLMDWNELEKHQEEFTRWALHGFLPMDALILLHGPAGSGKTTFFYDWAWSIATGTPWSIGKDWNGYPVTAPGRRILVVQTDETRSELISSLRRRGLDQLPNIRYRTEWTASMMPQLIRDIEEFRPDVVFIDSLSSVNKDNLVEENDVEYAKPVLFLRYLAGLYRFNCILTHHSNKQGDVRGSTAIQAAASMVLGLERDPKHPEADSSHRLLRISKARSRRPTCYSLECDFDSGQWVILGERDGNIDRVDGEISIKNSIVKFLSNRRNIKYTAEEIANELNHNYNSIRGALGALARDGIISRIANGRERLYLLAQEVVINPPELDHNDDHNLEVPHSKDSGSCDQVITENQKISDETSREFLSNAIAVPGKRPESSHINASTPDHEPDQVSDQNAIATPNSDRSQEWYSAESETEAFNLVAGCECQQQLLDLAEFMPRDLILKIARSLDDSEQILKWLDETQEPQPRKIWDVKVGDRVRCKKNRTAATVTRINPWGLEVRSGRTFLSWGYSDCEYLPEEEDPEILAQRLHERIYEGCKIKIKRHPEHKGLANKTGVVVKKSPAVGSQPQALIRFEDGPESYILLEAAELVRPKTFSRICYRTGGGKEKHYGAICTSNKKGDYFVTWDNAHTLTKNPLPDSLRADEFEVVE